MKCNEVRRQLVALADGRLGGSQRDSVLAHLRECAGCRELMRSLEADATGLRQDEPPEVPPFLTTRIMARVREAAGTSAGPVRAPVPARRLIATAAVILAATGIWLGASLGRVIFRQEFEYHDRVAVMECGLPLDGLANQLFGE